MQALFKTYGVDVYFAGHLHSYARSLPVFDSKVSQSTYASPNATVHVLVGGAGCDEMKVPDEENKRSAKWNAVADTTHYGTGVLHVLNASAVRWEYKHSSDLSVADSFVLTK